MTLGDLIEEQKYWDLNDFHLVYMDDVGFMIAHSDWERENLLSLEDCSLHGRLMVTDRVDVDINADYGVWIVDQTGNWLYMREL